MAYNEQYYLDKKKKLETKFVTKKDAFLSMLITSVATLNNELNEIQEEFKELIKAEQENKPQEEKSKKK